MSDSRSLTRSRTLCFFVCVGYWSTSRIWLLTIWMFVNDMFHRNRTLSLFLQSLRTFLFHCELVSELPIHPQKTNPFLSVRSVSPVVLRLSVLFPSNKPFTVLEDSPNSYPKWTTPVRDFVYLREIGTTSSSPK